MHCLCLCLCEGILFERNKGLFRAIGNVISFCIMTIKYTANTLKKLEQLFEEARYQIRFEKGQFHSGYCVMEEKRIAVINKFLDLEGKINALLDVAPAVGFKVNELSGEMQQFYRQIVQSVIAEKTEGRQMNIAFEQESGGDSET